MSNQDNQRSNLNEPERPEHMKAGPLLRLLDRGQLWTDLEAGLAAVCNGLEAHGGKGGLVIKIAAKMQNGQFIFESDLAVSAPLPARVPTIAFKGDDGELTQSDPRQPKFGVVKMADAANGVRSVTDDE